MPKPQNSIQGREGSSITPDASPSPAMLAPVHSFSLHENETDNIRFRTLLSEDLRNGIYKAKEFHGSGVKIVNMGELFAYPRLYNIPMERVQLSEKESSKFLLAEDDLIFARRSLTAEGAGKCSIVKEIIEPTTFESSIIRARPNKISASSDFLYYWFNSIYGKQALSSILRQVAVSGITGTDLSNLEIPVLERSVQDKVTSILSSLDDKITLNHATNATLEQIARAIFNSWFVDFDPVRAKARGEKPLGMDETTAALFPDRFEGSVLGMIPKGWGIDCMGQIAEIVGGSTPSTKENKYWENGVFHWTTPKDLSKNKDKILLDTERRITKEALSTISSGLLPVNTVLMSSRAPVGYLAIAKIPVAINQGYIAIKCHHPEYSEFTLLWCEHIMDEIKQRASGTTFAEITKRVFREIKVISPPEGIIKVFAKRAATIFDQITSHRMQSNALEALRDTLLPKLLSGEISVADAERLVERNI